MYKVAIIRKTTALYRLQGNSQISNDRLLRVRTEQASHLFNFRKYKYTPANCARAGDLCLFKSVNDAEKYNSILLHIKFAKHYLETSEYM